MLIYIVREKHFEHYTSPRNEVVAVRQYVVTDMSGLNSRIGQV